MSVSIYKNTQCKYNIDKLAKVVYLISEDALRDIQIDNGEAFVSGITEEPLALEVYNIALSDADELDERYKFTHTLTFSMHGYANYKNFQGKYYAIVKSMDEEYWLVNPLFPCKVTYTYTLDANGSHTDFTMATISNHPTLRIHGIEHATPYTCNGYKHCRFKSLKLNEKKYSIKSGNNVKYTNDGFKEIEFNKNSASLVEQFDGNNVQHSIQFNIKFDDYKSSWHYNLLEFMDNTYAAIVETTCDKYILSGFHFGLQPSFIVNSNSDMTLDNIQINLVDMYDNGGFIGYEDEPSIIHDDNNGYIYTTEHHGYECVGIGVAKYLLKKEIDAFGNPTGNYMCLEGYESQFSDLNIVGTFSTVEEFANPECGGDGCTLQTSMPDNIVFNAATSKSYSLISDTDWSLTSSMSHITVSPSNGLANTPYTVTITNTLTPTSSTTTSILTMIYCGKTKIINVSVEKGNSCFSAGATFDISANGQYVTVPTSCCVQGVTESSNTISNITIQNSYFKVYVPQNNTGSARTFTLNVLFCNGTTGEVIINQSSGFERWVKEGTGCTGNKKCDVERKYTGTTASDINTRTNETRMTNCVVSSDCSGTASRWVDTTETTCSGGKKYVVQAEQVSTDGGTTWTNTGNKRLGAETQDSPAECSGTTTYEDWRSADGYICDGTTKYARERLWTSTDNVNWVATNTYRRTNTVLETNSADCGWVHPSDTWKCEKWELADGYICEETTKYAREERFVRDCTNCNSCEEEWVATGVYRRTNTVLESNSEDCGYIKPSTAWTCTEWRVLSGANDYICEDGTKYTKERKYVRDCEDCNDCSTPWKATDVYRRGSTVLEENSTDCGYDPSVSGNCSEYRDNGDTICDGYDKYKYLRKYVRQCEDCSNCSAAWTATSIYKRGDLVQSNSIDCGYVPADTYVQWREDGYTCDGYAKYKRLRKYISEDNVNWYQTNIYKRGDLIEAKSFDCGYIPTENYYEWRQAGTMCDGYNKYNRERKYISDDGNRWYETNIYRRGSLIETNSADCGYVPPITYEYQWVITTQTTCIGYDKYYLYKQQRRVSGTSTWEDVIPTVLSYNGNGTQTPSLVEASSSDCGYVPPTTPIYKWVLLDASQYMCDECDVAEFRWVTINTYCNNIDKYAHQKLQYSLDGGTTWADVDPQETQEVLVEYNSAECGAGAYKIVSFGRYNSPLTTYCYGSNMYTIVSGDVLGNEALIANVTAATIGTCATAIDTNAFNGTSITAITIPSGITSIGNNAFGYSDLTNITFESSTPPTIGTLIFSHSNITHIYVPSGSVDAYKAVENLSTYADKIQAAP